MSKRKDFKIIVTSASMDIALFENYFNTQTLKVSGRMHPV
jgi:HrpA-like RNA helicase